VVLRAFDANRSSFIYIGGSISLTVSSSCDLGAIQHLLDFQLEIGLRVFAGCALAQSGSHLVNQRLRHQTSMERYPHMAILVPNILRSCWCQWANECVPWQRSHWLAEFLLGSRVEQGLAYWLWIAYQCTAKSGYGALNLQMIFQTWATPFINFQLLFLFVIASDRATLVVGSS